MFVLIQMTAPCRVVPQCISRGKQCFWRPAWRPLCIILLRYMSTSASLRWSLTLSPCRATSLSLTMGQSFLLTKKKKWLNRLTSQQKLIIWHSALSTSVDHSQVWSSYSIYLTRLEGKLGRTHLFMESFQHVLLLHYRCLMDSVLPGSSSKFLPREQDNRLCFSVQAFHFNQESGEQVTTPHWTVADQLLSDNNCHWSHFSTKVVNCVIYCAYFITLYVASTVYWWSSI